MSDNLLKKEFKTRDVQRMRNIITKKSGDKTTDATLKISLNGTFGKLAFPATPAPAEKMVEKSAATPTGSVYSLFLKPSIEP